MNVVTISSILEIPVASLIWSKASSIIRTFRKYWSISFFFSLFVYLWITYLQRSIYSVSSWEEQRDLKIKQLHSSLDSCPSQASLFYWLFRLPVRQCLTSLSVSPGVLWSQCRISPFPSRALPSVPRYEYWSLLRTSSPWSTWDFHLLLISWASLCHSPNSPRLVSGRFFHV